ncbi:MAG: virulence RhuM family protein [Bacteroidia bacterium]
MNSNQIIFYSTPKGHVKVEVVFEGETFWLTQKAMANLFGVAVPAISKHLKNIFERKELEQNSVVSILETTAADGKNYPTTYYRLEAILAVGYRVNSSQATQFRIWATNTLKEFITKGFVLDDERLKQGQLFGKDYFDELLERIREIRASERRFYQKITDLYALSVDYNKEDVTTKDFFASVQNKLHWAITGKTAAEIIYTEADAQKIYMGLKTWKYAPGGKILKSDVTVAKNYLNEAHISELNRIVSAYLDLAENNARRQQLMYMKNWSVFLTDFLKLSNYPILKDKGKVTMLEAKLKAETEFEKYRVIQDRNYESDFDREIKKIGKGKK